MTLNPTTQYASDSNLRARQRFWEHQTPRFDLVGWVLEVAGIGRNDHVLDVGCGNGAYLTELRHRHVGAVGCDLSVGMLAAVGEHQPMVNADVTDLPFASESFDVVLAPHMLYHVDDRVGAAREMRRVLRPGGRCVVVTNGRNHRLSLRAIVEAAVQLETPGWELRDPSTHVFSLENGEKVLRQAFDEISCIRPESSSMVTLTDPDIAADYIASIKDTHAAESTRPWPDVVDDVRQAVTETIEQDGVFTDSADCGAFVCR